MSNIFKSAAVLKLRFDSSKGRLTTEQLYDLPLTSKTGFDLDNVAKRVNADLKEAGEESFVKTGGNPEAERLTLMLEVVKEVIADKQVAIESREKSVAKAQERQKLLALLDRKSEEELDGLSKEEIQKRIAALD